MIPKTIKYQINESYAEGFNEAREFIAKLIEEKCLCAPKLEGQWCAYCHAARIARNLKN